MGKIRSTLADAARVTYEVPAEADEVLTNWARWAAPRHGIRRRENILAKMAKADRWAGVSADLGAPPQFAVPPDADSAWAAEKVLCNPVFWPPARTLIQQHWLYRQTPVSTCRLLGFPVQNYDHELWRAACMFLNRYRAAAERVGRAAPGVPAT